MSTEKVQHEYGADEIQILLMTEELTRTGRAPP